MGAELSAQPRSLTRAREHLVTLLADPPREVYGRNDLGPEVFAFCGRVVVREDFFVPSVREPRGIDDMPLRLATSWWHALEPKEVVPKAQSASGTPEDKDANRPRTQPRDVGNDLVFPEKHYRPIVLFLHAGTQSRAQGVRDALAAVLSRGMDFVSVDFSNCGLSDGFGPLTVGMCEADDVRSVISFILSTGHAQKGSIGLWGHSLGAAAALQFVGIQNGDLVPEVLAETGSMSLSPYRPEVDKRKRSLFRAPTMRRSSTTDGQGDEEAPAGPILERKSLSAVALTKAKKMSFRRSTAALSSENGFDDIPSSQSQPTLVPAFNANMSPDAAASGRISLPEAGSGSSTKSFSSMVPSPRVFFPSLTQQDSTKAEEEEDLDIVERVFETAETLDLRLAVGAVALDSTFASMDWLITTLFRGPEVKPPKRKGGRPRLNTSESDTSVNPRLPSDPDDYDVAKEIQKRSPAKREPLDGLAAKDGPSPLAMKKKSGKRGSFWQVLRKEDPLLRNFSSEGAEEPPTPPAADPGRPQRPHALRSADFKRSESAPDRIASPANNPNSPKLAEEDLKVVGGTLERILGPSKAASRRRSRIEDAWNAVRKAEPAEGTAGVEPTSSKEKMPEAMRPPKLKPVDTALQVRATAKSFKEGTRSNFINELVVKAGAAMVRTDLVRSLRSAIGDGPDYVNGMQPRLFAGRCTVPAIFGHAEEDEFLTSEHLQAFLEDYGGRRSLISFPGGHFKERPAIWRTSAADFLVEQLRSAEVLEADDAASSTTSLSPLGLSFKAGGLMFNLDWLTGIAEEPVEEGENDDYIDSSDTASDFSVPTPSNQRSPPEVPDTPTSMKSTEDELMSEDSDHPTSESRPKPAASNEERKGRRRRSIRRRHFAGDHKYTKEERAAARKFYESQRYEFAADFSSSEGSLGMRLVPAGEARRWAVVVMVTEGGQAEKLGIKARDVVMKVNSVKGVSFDAVIEQIKTSLRDRGVVSVNFARQKSPSPKKGAAMNNVRHLSAESGPMHDGLESPNFDSSFKGPIAKPKDLSLSPSKGKMSSGEERRSKARVEFWKSIGPVIEAADVPDAAVLVAPWDVMKNPCARALTSAQTETVIDWRKQNGVAVQWREEVERKYRVEEEEDDDGATPKMDAKGDSPAKPRTMSSEKINAQYENKGVPHAAGGYMGERKASRDRPPSSKGARRSSFSPRDKKEKERMMDAKLPESLSSGGFPISTPNNRRSSAIAGEDSSTFSRRTPTSEPGKLSKQLLQDVAAQQDRTQTAAAERDLKRAAQYRKQAETAERDDKPRIAKLLRKKAALAEELGKARQKGLEEYAAVVRRQQADRDMRKLKVEKKLDVSTPLAGDGVRRSAGARRKSIASSTDGDSLVGEATDRIKTSGNPRRRHSMLETSSNSSGDDNSNLSGPRSYNTREDSFRRKPMSGRPFGSFRKRRTSRSSSRGSSSRFPSPRKGSLASSTLTADDNTSSDAFGFGSDELFARDTLESESYDSDDTTTMGNVASLGQINNKRQSSRLRRALTFMKKKTGTSRAAKEGEAAGADASGAAARPARRMSRTRVSKTKGKKSSEIMSVSPIAAATIPEIPIMNSGSSSGSSTPEKTGEVNIEALTIFDILDAYWLETVMDERI